MQALYHKTPSPSLWVWSFYPEGEIWKEGVKKYGERVVDVMTGTCLKAKDEWVKAVHDTIALSDCI